MVDRGSKVPREEPISGSQLCPDVGSRRVDQTLWPKINEVVKVTPEESPGGKRITPGERRVTSSGGSSWTAERILDEEVEGLASLALEGVKDGEQSVLVGLR